MRRRFAATLFRISILMLTAGMGTILLAQDCPQTMPAYQLAEPIETNGPWITEQCPDACGSLLNRPTFLRWYENPEGLVDSIIMWCKADAMGPAREIAIESSHSCWNCMIGCAGTNCSDRELCLPHPGTAGSDCRRWVCEDPANYKAEEDWDPTNPSGVICRRTTACPPPPPCTSTTTVSIAGPTSIRPGATCTWSASAASTTCTYKYDWYIGYYWVGTGQYYTGGRPSWISSGPWKLRVDAHYGSTYVGSREITISESPTARLCVN